MQVVRIVGNARTKQSLLGQTAIVKRAVGLGGWHWLTVSDQGGMEMHWGIGAGPAAQWFGRQPEMPSPPLPALQAPQLAVGVAPGCPGLEWVSPDDTMPGKRDFLPPPCRCCPLGRRSSCSATHSRCWSGQLGWKW